MKTVFKVLSILFVCLSLIACSEEDDGISVRDLQAEAIAEENRFQLSAVVNVFDFSSNFVTLEEDAGYYILSAFSGNKALYLRFPEVKEGNYLAVNDSEIYLFYIDENGRNYFSRNDAFPNSDVRINITSVDSVQSVFYADFSGNLYDIDAKKPSDRENQLNVSAGRINKISF